jgi:hypothetical protein
METFIRSLTRTIACRGTLMSRKTYHTTAALLLSLAPGALGATYTVAPEGQDGGAGSEESPWRTIQHAVSRAGPGDTVSVRTGIYRERVVMAQGGVKGRPLVITAAPGARVVVTGADLLKEWQHAPGTSAPIWVHAWPHRFPIGDSLIHPEDAHHEVIGRAEQVIAGDRLLQQVLQRTQMAPGTFFVDLAARQLYVWLRDNGDPGKTEMEASIRPNWLEAPPRASYVHLRGIRFRYAANHAQHGGLVLRHGVGPEGAPGPVGWVVEGCVFERANSSGASLAGRGHRIERSLFQENGQLGFGASRCDDTLVRGCGVYRNNTKGYATGWEAGGLKVTLSRGFRFDRCRVIENRGPGIWYDIGNEAAEIQRCVIAGNDEAGIFYEISYGLHAHDNLIVDNANRGVVPGPAWGAGGITISSSEDCVLEQNTLVNNRDGIAFREQERRTPRIGGRVEVRIVNRNVLVRRNIVAASPGYNVALWVDTSFFGPHPSGDDKNEPIREDPAAQAIRFVENVLYPLPARPNYLYGAPWRNKSRSFTLPRELGAASGLPVSDVLARPLGPDTWGPSRWLARDAMARKLAAGVREPGLLPRVAGWGDAR